MNMPAREELIKQVYLRAISQKDYEDVRYLTLIGTKILLLDLDKKKVSYDRYRLIDELVYFSYYNGLKPTYPINFFLPIILANRSKDGLYEDIVDLSETISLLYSKADKKYEYTLDAFCYEKILGRLINKKSGGANFDSTEDWLEFFSEIKEEMIPFNPYEANKKDNISFQRHKIGYLNAIHKILNEFDDFILDSDGSAKRTGIIIFDVLFDAINFSLAKEGMAYRYSSSGELNLLSIFTFILQDASDFIMTEEEGIDKKFESRIVGFFSEKRFNESMSKYLLRMRHQEILKDRYRYSSDPRYLLELSRGDYCNDVLLGRVEVVDKKVVDGRTFVKVFTKSGPYIFKF